MCQERAKKYEAFLVKTYSKSRLDCDRRTVLEDKFGEQEKGDMLNFLGTIGYSETTSKDPLMLEDIIKTINECMNNNKEKVQKLETEIVH